MRKRYAILVLFLVVVSSKAQIVNIPDANFKAKLLAANTNNEIAADSNGYWVKIDTNNDGEIQQSEALQVGYLNVHNTDITTLIGINSFTNLSTLDCSWNALTSLDVTALLGLTDLNCSVCTIQTLNISGLLSLNKLDCSSNAITNLDLSNLISLQYFNYSSNQLPNLNVNQLTGLSDLYCDSNGITNLTISNLAYLQNLGCGNNQLSTLNVSGLIHLQTLQCYGNMLTSLNVSGLTNLHYLSIESNQITAINLNGLINLQEFECAYNSLSNLDLSGLTSLQILYCPNNQITNLNVNGLANLVTLSCYSNLLASINITGLTNLLQLNCSYNQLQSIDVGGLTNLQDLDCNNNQLTGISISGLPNFLHLNCSQNQLTNININGQNSLEYLDCSGNLLQNLNVTGLTNLQYLVCGENQLPILNVSGLTNLQTLSCYSNQFTTLDLNGLINLNNLNFSYNQIETIDFNGVQNLLTLYCDHNLLSTLNVNNLTNLENLSCGENPVSTLDLSSLSHLTSLYCADSSQLSTVLIKNGSLENDLTFYNDPELQYICADEGQISGIQEMIEYGFLNNCHVNSYCSFTPGGTFYSIQGTNRYDEEANGCSPTDSNYPNLKLSFTDGTNVGNLIANETGTYRFDVQEGTQTFYPTLENPTYFSISPTSATVNFPSSASPDTQDFCITPNGIHNDLEVTLLPIDIAQSGFDATYKIIYKNKGTHTQSGSVTFAFEDNVLDYVSAIPNVDIQSVSNLTWNFTNLAPFETRVIDISLNLNSPIEVPPLVSGDILNYTTTVTGLPDETPTDNSAVANQTVVNGFDPNSKTCVEGTTIMPSMVGNYVHYIIHFENDGTANVQNIVVKDLIDTNKFDIATLVPLSGSAPYVTRITNTNQVEFIFEHINLPFAIGSNTGYVAFKIKTKPTLVLNDTFSNTASIFFDYNYPVLTNTATTTIAVLANQDFDFSTYFSVYPVPAKQVLNIQTKEGIVVKSMEVYNALGQLVIAIPNAESVAAIDVSNLKTGTYFIKLNTEKGTTNTKFVKE
jgi:Leucine-rich repeat (LRR) protein